MKNPIAEAIEELTRRRALLDDCIVKLRACNDVLYPSRVVDADFEAEKKAAAETPGALKSAYEIFDRPNRERGSGCLYVSGKHGKYYGKVVVNGKRYTFPLKTADRELAEKYLDEKVAELRAAALNPVPPVVPQSSRPLSKEPGSPSNVILSKQDTTPVDRRCQRCPKKCYESQHLPDGKCLVQGCWCGGFVGLEQFGAKA